MGKLAPLHNLLSPVFFSAILLFTHFRDFPYIIRHVYDRLMHCISGHAVTPGVTLRLLARQPINTQYNIYTKNSTNIKHQLEHRSTIPSQVLQTQHKREREAPQSLKLSSLYYQLIITSLMKYFLITQPLVTDIISMNTCTCTCTCMHTCAMVCST